MTSKEKVLSVYPDEMCECGDYRFQHDTRGCAVNRGAPMHCECKEFKPAKSAPSPAGETAWNPPSVEAGDYMDQPFRLAKAAVPEPAPTAEEQPVELPPLEDTFGIGVVPLAEALHQRERQLSAALRSNREKDAQLAKAESSRKHTQNWYASHYGKLEDWARKILPDPWRTQFFHCVANGTYGHEDVGERYRCNAGFDVVPSGYIHMDGAKGQLVIDQTRRAEEAETQLAEKDAKNAELEKRVETLTVLDRASEEQRNWLITKKTEVEASLRAVSEAMKDPDPWACLKRIRAIVEGK